MTTSEVVEAGIAAMEEHAEVFERLARGPRATPSVPLPLTYEYTYDHRIANCDTCPLQDVREETICLSQRPERWNGLMIVGEGPGTTESRLKVPFVGRSGNLLDRLLHLAGLSRKETYVANATLCLPPMETKAKAAALPSAVYACRPRLLTEIQQLQPRVILALGNHALHTLVGEETEHAKRIPVDCATCGNERKWKRWGCSRCKHVFGDQPVSPDKTPPPGSPCDLTPESCNLGGKKKPAKWQPRNMVCSECEGKKTKIHTWTNFHSDHKISWVAGGVFQASELPLGAYLQDPEHTWIVPTYHPAHLLRNTETAAQKKEGGQFLASAALSHVKKAARLLEQDPAWRFSWRSATTPEHVRSYCSRPGFYSCDLETDAKDPFEVTQIKCAGINYYDDKETIVLDFDGLPPDHPLFKAFVEFLLNKDTYISWQNGALYDLIVIKRILGVDALVNYQEDARVYHNAIAPDEPHDLQHIVFACTDAPAWKPPKTGGDGGLKFDTKEEFHEYCGKDTRGTAVAITHLRNDIIQNNLQTVVALDMAKFRLAYEMTMNGMAVDRQQMLQVGARAQYEMEVALKQMRDFVGRLPDHVAPKKADINAFDLNPNSPVQLQWALFDPNGPCKFVPSSFTRTGRASTDKNSLLDFNDHPFVDALFRYKNNHKVKSVWIDGMHVHADMRIRAKWNPIGARTGRWTSSPNFMNWQKWIRSMIVAPPGRKIVGADKAQVELRIMAALSGDKEMIRRCANADESRKLEPDYDPHSYVASLSFHDAFTDLDLTYQGHDKEDPRCSCQTCTRKSLRDVAKRVIYGLGYGAGAAKVREAIYDGGYEGPPITLQMVEQTVAAVFKAFPDVLVWREEQLARAQSTGRIYDALIGRYREFPLGDVDATVCYNYPIQSTAASDMDMGTLLLHSRLRDVDPSAFIMAQVHDAIYVECDENRAEPVAALIEECLSSEVRFHAGAAYMPLPAGAAIADNWQDAA